MAAILFSIVRNEEDIIESFIRYHSLFFDELWIADNQSSDNTPQIIKQLIQEGLKIVLLTDHQLSYCQSEKMTELAYKIGQKYPYAWLFPLDADEFIFSDNPDQLKQDLQNLEADTVYYHFPWITYVKTSQDQENEKFIPAQIKYHRNYEPQLWYKFAFFSGYMFENSFVINQGNHGLSFRDPLHTENIKALNHPTLKIAHFPIRSTNQLLSKVTIGWLAYLLNTNRRSNWGNHWKKLYNKVKCGETITDQSMRELSLLYGLSKRPDDLDVVFDPLPLSNPIKLKYTPDRRLFVSNLLSFCEQLIQEHLKQVNERSIQ